MSAWQLIHDDEKVFPAKDLQRFLSLSAFNRKHLTALSILASSNLDPDRRHPKQNFHLATV
eukprot:CAMPEP_0185264330 /NCGR_PEP_ID=MMETSP1359-20130426/22047_1 /TAXON_ID=552665 /ORGANISM="Bigelowiella longifila, Strain CCMP242" /LENGTH=60 /DNA_ID=CAMNT_0027852819 /DNA_START=87 /DNA_END=266 /DNA_ORIENTATION=-